MKQHLDKASGARLAIKLRKSLFIPKRYKSGKRGTGVAQYLALQGFGRRGATRGGKGNAGSITAEKGLGMKRRMGSEHCARITGREMGPHTHTSLTLNLYLLAASQAAANPNRY